MLLYLRRKLLLLLLLLGVLVDLLLRLLLLWLHRMGLRRKSDLLWRLWHLHGRSHPDDLSELLSWRQSGTRR